MVQRHAYGRGVEGGSYEFYVLHYSKSDCEDNRMRNLPSINQLDIPIGQLQSLSSSQD